MSDYVVFPVGKEAEADAYLAFCNANPPGDLPEWDTWLWQPANPTDKYGQRAVPYLGPTGYIRNGQPYPEPVGGPEARAEGVLVPNIKWYDPEEEEEG